MNSHTYTRPRGAFGDVLEYSNRNYGVAPNMMKKAPVRQYGNENTQYKSYSESPEPVPCNKTFTLSPKTCVPSFLHHVGLSQYASVFMEKGVHTIAQLQAMPYDVVRTYVASEEHCTAILFSLNASKNTTHATSATTKQMSHPSSTMESQSLSMPRVHSMSMSPLPAVPTTVEPCRIVSQRRNDPYAFSCIDPEDSHEFLSSASDSYRMPTKEGKTPDLDSPRYSMPSVYPIDDSMTPRVKELSLSLTDIVGNLSHDWTPLERSFVGSTNPTFGSGMNMSMMCTCLVRFKYRQTEFSSSFIVNPGQYVMVSGDRGQDLGLVLRVNKGGEKGYVEHTGPQGALLRLAYQKEVDYANGPLRMDEVVAADVCRAKVNRLGLDMEVHSTEYQYDKKKLTIYYESSSRVDFVALLKDLFREFGCRIWMEKVPQSTQQMQPRME